MSTQINDPGQHNRTEHTTLAFPCGHRPSKLCLGDRETGQPGANDLPRSPVARIRRWWVPILALLALIARPPTAGAEPSSLHIPQCLEPLREGWIPVFCDDFSGNAGTFPSDRKWVFSTWHNPGTGEVEINRKDLRNVSLDGRGHVMISLTHDDDGNYYSALLQTRYVDFMPPPGGTMKIEARIKTAVGDGLNTAFWALGKDFLDGGAWPGVGEIDVMENLGALPNLTFSGVQCPTCNSPPGIAHRELAPAGQAWSDEFHTWSLIWSNTPAMMTWYVDGRPYFSVSSADTGESGWVFDHGFYLLLNLITGGPFYGLVDPSQLPATMYVDYVRVSVRFD